MIYVYDPRLNKLVPKPERHSKLKLSDAEREQQRKGSFRDTDNSGNVDPYDAIRQGPGVYSGA